MPGDKDPELPVRIAPCGNSDQRHEQEVDRATRRPDRSIDLIEQQSLRVQKEIVCEHAAETEDKPLQTPSRIRRSVPIELFDQDQARQCRRQPPGKQDAPDVSGSAEVNVSQPDSDARSENAHP